MSNWIIFPGRGNNKKCLKPPHSYVWDMKINIIKVACEFECSWHISSCHLWEKPSEFQNCKRKNVHPKDLTNRPWKAWLFGRLSFWVSAYVEGASCSWLSGPYLESLGKGRPCFSRWGMLTTPILTARYDWIGISWFKTTSHTLPETNIRPQKIDPWKRRFLLETIIFRGYVSFREGKSTFIQPSMGSRSCILIGFSCYNCRSMNGLMFKSYMGK